MLLGIVFYPVFDGIILPMINLEPLRDTGINIFKKSIRNVGISLVIDVIPVIIRWTIGITSEQQTEIINGLLFRIGDQFMRGGSMKEGSMKEGFMKEGSMKEDSSENYNIIINNTNYKQFRMNVKKLYNNLNKYNSQELYYTTYLEIYDKKKINSSI